MTAAPKTLAEALAALQAAMPRVAKAQTARTGTYSYDYADLTDCTDALYPVMAPLGLSFMAKPTMFGDQFVLAYSLKHSSGEQEDGAYPLPSSGSPQQIGSAITYARRYSLCAVTGLAPGGDDDDGKQATDAHPAPAPARKPRNVPDAQLVREGRMTRAQAAEHDRLAADTRRNAAGKKADRSRPRAPEASPWDSDFADVVTPEHAANLRVSAEQADLTEPEDKPGSIAPPQHRALERLLSMIGIETDNRDARHALCAGWAGLDELASLNDLSMSQAAECIRAGQDAYDRGRARANA